MGAIHQAVLLPSGVPEHLNPSDPAKSWLYPSGVIIDNQGSLILDSEIDVLHGGEGLNVNVQRALFPLIRITSGIP